MKNHKCIICNLDLNSEEELKEHIETCFQKEKQRIQRNYKNKILRNLGFNIGDYSEKFKKEFLEERKIPPINLFGKKKLIGMGEDSEWIVEISELINRGFRNWESKNLRDEDLIERVFIHLINHTTIEELIHSETNISHLDYSNEEFLNFLNQTLLEGQELARNMIYNKVILQHIWDLLNNDKHELLLETLKHVSEIIYETILSSHDYGVIKPMIGLKKQIKLIIKIKKRRNFWKIINSHLRWYPAYLDDKYLSQNETLELLCCV